MLNWGKLPPHFQNVAGVTYRDREGVFRLERRLWGWIERATRCGAWARKSVPPAGYLDTLNSVFDKDYRSTGREGVDIC